MKKEEKAKMKEMKKTHSNMLGLNRRGFGINEVIGIAAGIIIAAVVIIPGLKTFASEIMDQMGTWWSSLAADIFQE